jgi:hypothetical protein
MGVVIEICEKHLGAVVEAPSRSRSLRWEVRIILYGWGCTVLL